MNKPSEICVDFPFSNDTLKDLHDSSVAIPDFIENSELGTSVGFPPEKKNDTKDECMSFRNIEGYNVVEYNKSNIYIIENILDDKLCEELISLINILPSNRLLYSSGNNVECIITILNDFLNYDDSLLYEFSTDISTYNSLLDKINNKKNIYTNKLNGITEKEIRNYISILNKKTSIIEKILKTINTNLCFEFNSGFCLRKIYGPTRPHIDGLKLDKVFNKTHFQQYSESRKVTMNSTIIRNSSAIFTLNDNYDGGIFKFPYYDISIKLKKGSVIIFPPYWTHKHETTELLNKTFRYTLNTWYGELIDTNYDTITT